MSQSTAPEKISLTFITGNKGKIAEITAILGDSFEIDNIPLDLHELQGSCAQEIATQKAQAAYKHLGRPVVIEDTCLGFSAHKGLPGPYVKWYLEKLGTEGLYKTIEAFEDKTGCASCIFAVARGPEDVICFEGRVEGTIVPPRGTQGFGWDPIFQPSEGDGRTFGELSKEEKNAFSHRRRGLEKLKAHFLAEQEEPNAKRQRM